MKFKDVLASASANLWRNKGRTILTIIAIFIGAFTIAMTIGIKIGVNDYIDKQVNNIGRDDLLLIQKNVGEQSADATGPQEFTEERGGADEAYILTQKDIDSLEKIKGLSEIKPMESFSVDYIQGANDKKFVLSASGADGLSVDLKAGRQVAEKGEAFEIILAPDYVKSLGFKSPKAALNQTVELAASSSATNKRSTVTATIVGVRNPSIVNNGNTVVSKALSDQLVAINQAGLPATMTNEYYALTATMKDTSEKNIAKLKEKLLDKGYSASTYADQVGMIHATIDAITGVLTLFGAIALLAASFGIINTLYMSVADRTREIGLMKAMGMSRGNVFLTFSIEAMLIGFWGSVLGVATAFGGGLLVNKVATDSFLTDLEGFQLVQFTWPSVCGIIIVIMGIAFLAGTLPANRAARLDPISALRYE